MKSVNHGLGEIHINKAFNAVKMYNIQKLYLMYIIVPGKIISDHSKDPTGVLGLRYEDNPTHVERVGRPSIDDVTQRDKEDTNKPAYYP